MINPVEKISAARERIARIAALRMAISGVPPSAVALALGLALAWIGELTWVRWGFELPPPLYAGVRAGLLAAGCAGMALAAFMASRQYRKAQDFAGAAEKIDRLLGAEQEIVTLADLSDRGRGEAATERRSALFPILWRRTAASLSGFDPAQAFKLELRAPLTRSSISSLAIAILFGLAMLALVRPPSPYSATARELRSAADALAASDSTPQAQALAERLRAAATALDNPAIPPRQKLEQLAAVSRELESKTGKGQDQNAAGQEQKSAGGNRKGKGSGGKGEGATGKGESAKGEGQGAGQGTGGNKPENANGQTDKNKSKDAELAQLSSDLRKAEAKLESAESPENRAQTKPGEEKKGEAPKPGENPNKRGTPQKPGEGLQELSGSKPSQTGQEPENKAREEARAGKRPNKDSGSDSGDTHLGQFPEPGRYERFYKPGEHGPALEIKNAKYVLFRIPPAAPSGSGGKTVLDKERPMASAAYVNIPLKEEHFNATPDERQLVPPRYRDLIQ